MKIIFSIFFLTVHFALLSQEEINYNQDLDFFENQKLPLSPIDFLLPEFPSIPNYNLELLPFTDREETTYTEGFSTESKQSPLFISMQALKNKKSPKRKRLSSDNDIEEINQTIIYPTDKLHGINEITIPNPLDLKAIKEVLNNLFLKAPYNRSKSNFPVICLEPSCTIRKELNKKKIHSSGFKKESDLESHMQRYCTKTLIAFSCNFCNDEFSYFSLLWCHIILEHVDPTHKIRNFKCPLKIVKN